MRAERNHKGHLLRAVRAVLAGLVVAAMAASVSAAEKNVGKTPLSTGIYTLPSRMCGPFFLVPLELPSKPGRKSRELTFLVDTGTRISSVDPDSITEREVKPGERVDLINARAGPLTFRRLAASAHQLDGLSQMVGEPLDGILGVTAFRDFLLTLDYPAERLSLARGTLPPADGREIFDARGGDIRPFVSIKVGSRKHQVLINTGSSSSFSLRARKGLRWRIAPVPVEAFMNGTHLKLRKAGRLHGMVRIGAHRITEPLVYLTTNKIESMGGRALKHFTVTIDLRNQRVRLRHPERAPIEMAPLQATGAVLRPMPSGLQVITVLKGSAAEEAGLRAGDLIVTANGKDATKHHCPGGGDHPDHSLMAYEVRRGRETVSVKVRKAVLVE